MRKKSIYINDIAYGMNLVDEPFVLQEFDVKTSKQGKEYYNILLSDRTGDIRGKVWSEQMSNCDRDLKVGDIVTVVGTVQEYAEKPQIIIESMVKAIEFPVEEFLPVTGRDRSLMISDLDTAINQLGNPHLKDLMMSIWGNPDLKDMFTNYPAAEKIHHGYVGGLLEHVWEMWQLAQPFLRLYKGLDRDLFFAGLFLHDIGKLEELEIQGATIIRTTPGRLVAHIGQGLLMVDRLVQNLEGFPVDLRDKLYHLILSHQGELEFGSPIKPQMLEGLVLNMVDMNSADMNQATKHMENDKTPGDFTEYHKWLKRSLFSPTPS